jgi:hypothetical protein
VRHRRREGGPAGRLPHGPAREMSPIDRFKIIQTKIQMISKKIKPIKLCSFQKGPSGDLKNEIKYRFEGFDERNNFLHRNFSRFEMDFK